MYKTIVLTKVVAVHLVNLLGYDMLFQDVDIVWYKHPLPRFQNDSAFDISFADDGARWVMTFPYSVNTGFFYARHNERTRHLFRSWLFQLDILFLSNGDQPVMKTILPEESSLTGLKIKVLKGDEFPCGNRILQPRYRDFMKNLLEGKNKNTYMLHVNWTHGKKEKLGLMKQMGIWYVRENVCSDLAHVESNALDTCCSSEPLVSCHNPDRPSVPSCSSSTAKEKGVAMQKV